MLLHGTRLQGRDCDRDLRIRPTGNRGRLTANGHARDGSATSAERRAPRSETVVTLDGLLVVRCRRCGRTRVLRILHLPVAKGREHQRHAWIWCPGACAACTE